MLPTLKPGQNVLVFTWAYLWNKPKVGDIVAIEKDNRQIVKRIHYCSDHDINVMGDNESMSTDSREFGPITKEQIIGRVIWY